MSCIEDNSYEILLSQATPKQCEEFVKKNTDEMYYVPGGYKILGAALKGDSIPVGIRGTDLIFQFIKPCYGFFVLKIENAQDEIEKVRADFKK